MPISTELYVALAALVAVGLWVVVRSGNPTRPLPGSFGEFLKPRPLTRREELLKARARVKWQLSLSPLRNPMNDQGVKDDLRAILAEINAELSETQPDKRAARRGLQP
jgi:hypothetical protein